MVWVISSVLSWWWLLLDVDLVVVVVDVVDVVVVVVDGGLGRVVNTYTSNSLSTRSDNNE